MKTNKDLLFYVSPQCMTIEFITNAYCIEATSDIKGTDDGSGTIEDWGEIIEG